jgi:hypothetical protein
MFWRIKTKLLQKLRVLLNKHVLSLQKLQESNNYKMIVSLIINLILYSGEMNQRKSLGSEAVESLLGKRQFDHANEMNSD